MGLNDKINGIASGTALANPYTPRIAELGNIAVSAVFTIDSSVIDQTDIDAIQLDIDAFDAAKASLATAISDFTTDINNHYDDHWNADPAYAPGDPTPATSLKTNFALLQAAFDTKNKVNAVDELPPIDYTNGDYYKGTITVDDGYNSTLSDALVALAADAAAITGGDVTDSAPVIAGTSLVNGVRTGITTLNDTFSPLAAQEVATYAEALNWLTAYGFVNFATQQTDPEVIDKLGKFTTGIV